MDVTDKRLANLTAKEREEVYAILNDFVKTGSSDKFDDLINKDFEEMPVDIETFITDPNYLGSSFVNEDGKCIVYPFWIETLKKLFADGVVNYNEVILTGGIGLGKTTIAVIGAAYTIYKLLCLKNPQLFYEQKPNSKIYVAFFNITLELSYGVAYRDLQEALINSPWFKKRGIISGRKNLIYTPGKGVEFMVGSKPSHALGKNVFCLSGDTDIRLTNNTYKKLKMVDDKVAVYNKALEVMEDTNSTYKSINTLETADVIKVKLSDSTIFTCTPDHSFLLSNGKYKQAKDLKPGDDFAEVDNNGIIRTRKVR